MENGGIIMVNHKPLASIMDGHMTPSHATGNSFSLSLDKTVKKLDDKTF